MGNVCAECIGKKNASTFEDIPKSKSAGNVGDIVNTQESQQEINAKEKETILTEEKKLDDFNKTGDDV